MSWQSDWKKWTHTTYGLLQAVHLAKRVTFGNHSKFEDTIGEAQVWSPSALGFVSKASQRPLKRGSIHIRSEEAENIIHSLPSQTLEILLIGTVSVTEVLLADLLVTRRPVTKRPDTFSNALEQLEKELRLRSSLARCSWAIDAAHEMRILRNCLVHAAANWSPTAVAEYKRRFHVSPPTGMRITISIDDLFRYRRAARTVLNAATTL
jgi:hypothetical protein